MTNPPRNHSCQAVLLLQPPNQLNPPDSQVGPDNGKTVSLVIRRQDGRKFVGERAFPIGVLFSGMTCSFQNS